MIMTLKDGNGKAVTIETTVADILKYLRGEENFNYLTSEQRALLIKNIEDNRVRKAI